MSSQDYHENSPSRHRETPNFGKNPTFDKRGKLLIPVTESDDSYDTADMNIAELSPRINDHTKTFSDYCTTTTATTTTAHEKVDLKGLNPNCNGQVSHYYQLASTRSGGDGNSERQSLYSCTPQQRRSVFRKRTDGVSCVSPTSVHSIGVDGPLTELGNPTRNRSRNDTLSTGYAVVGPKRRSSVFKSEIRQLLLKQGFSPTEKVSQAIRRSKRNSNSSLAMAFDSINVSISENASDSQSNSDENEEVDPVKDNDEIFQPSLRSPTAVIEKTRKSKTSKRKRIQTRAKRRHTNKLKKTCSKLRDLIQQSWTNVLTTNQGFMEITHGRAESKWILYPDSPLRTNWERLIVLIILYHLFAAPYFVAFGYSRHVQPIDLLFCAMFCIDIFLNFRTGLITSRGSLELDPHVIYNRYVTTWLPLDVLLVVELLTVPLLGIGFGLLDQSQPEMRLVFLVRLLRVFRVAKVQKQLERVVRNRQMFRLLKLFFMLMLLWHWISCSYWFICSVEDTFGGDNWSPTVDEREYPGFKRYLVALFWGIMVTTGVGREVDPLTTAQYIFTIVAITLGVFFYAIIIGSATSLIASIDEGDAELRNHVETANSYMVKRSVNENLRKRILENLEFLQTSNQGFTQRNTWFLDGLHPTLKLELSLDIYRRFIYNVPMFREISLECLIGLINIMDSRIYLRDEIVVERGEKGSEMFFIQTGLLEVLECGVRLNVGDFFGEQSLILSTPRNCTVKCVVFSELLILTRDNITLLFQEYEDFEDVLVEFLIDKIGRIHKRERRYWKYLQNLFAVVCGLKGLGSSITQTDVFSSNVHDFPLSHARNTRNRIRKPSNIGNKMYNVVSAYYKRHKNKSFTRNSTSRQNKNFVESEDGYA